MADRLRWWVARQLDRHPRTCSRLLEAWAGRDRDYGRRLTLTGRTPGCTWVAVRYGVCGCGKLGQDGSIARRGLR